MMSKKENNKPTPSRPLSRHEIEKLREKTTEIPNLLPYAHNVGSAVVKPIDKGRAKGLSVSSMHEQTSVQLQQIYGQVQTLLDQANAIKQRVEISERIYTADMNFKPIIGHHYFLYNRSNGTDLLSMISPNEWGKSLPFDSFIAHVKLLSDHTWEIVEE